MQEKKTVVCPIELKEKAGHNTKDLLVYVLVAFLGGNTSGGLIFKGSNEALARIEKKVEGLENKIMMIDQQLVDLKLAGKK